MPGSSTSKAKAASRSLRTAPRLASRFLRPPIGCPFDLALCARLDTDGKRHKSAETLKPREEFLGRNAFLSVSLIERGKEFSFLLGREFYNRFIASSEDGYGRSLGQREAFNDYLAADHDA